jgi:lysozyme
MTDEGVELIREFEGFRAEAYRDPVGIWTIGYGHTSMAGPPNVKPGLVMTRAEADDILKRDVEKFAVGVRKSLTRQISPLQFSALVSFAYNVGLDGFRKSSVLKAVNAGDDDAVPRRLGLWVKASGQTLPGLVRRRAAEAALFVSKRKVPDTRVPDTPVPKPVTQSKTAFAVFTAILLILLQFAAKTFGVVLGIVAAVAVLLLLVFILHERLLKLKDEVL